MGTARKERRKWVAGWLLAGLVLWLGAGCGSPGGESPAEPAQAPAGGEQPAAVAAAPVAAAPVAAGDTEELKEPAVLDTYIYTPVGKRDPFRSAYKEPKGPTKSEEGIVRTPLQLFEIDQLKLIAVISGISQPRAMVMAPDGKGYVVKIGTKIGKHDGRVVRIRNDEVVIAEDFRDWNNRRVTNYISVKLKKEEDKLTMP